MQIIERADVTDYLGDTVTIPSNLDALVERSNRLVTEAWRNPTTEVPEWVALIALEAIARVARNPKGLQSWTRSVDDASRTERVSDGGDGIVAGLRLTDDEKRRLAGPRRRPRYRTVRVGLGY